MLCPDCGLDHHPVEGQVELEPVDAGEEHQHAEDMQDARLEAETEQAGIAAEAAVDIAEAQAEAAVDIAEAQAEAEVEQAAELADAIEAVAEAETMEESTAVDEPVETTEPEDDELADEDPGEPVSVEVPPQLKDDAPAAAGRRSSNAFRDRRRR